MPDPLALLASQWRTEADAYTQDEAMVRGDRLLRRVAEELEHVLDSDPPPRFASPETEYDGEDRLLTVRDVAGRLSVQERYVYDHHHEWPFTKKVGRKIRFSERGLEQWVASQ